MKLKILHFNDIHSRYDNLARIASAIEQLKNKNTLILDAGDLADFMSIDTEGTDGRISSEILNEIGCNARIFGNNEGFSGPEKGKIISSSSNFPVITCNIYTIDGEKVNYLRDAELITINSIRILIIGVTSGFNVFYNLTGLSVKDPKAEVQRVLKKYSREKYDLVILLSHLGLVKDKIIAHSIPEIDIIIGGHFHVKLENPLIVNDTIICQAGHFGEVLGELELNFDQESHSIKNMVGRLIPSKNYPPHPKILGIINENHDIAVRRLSKPLFTVDKNLNHSLTQENAIGNLLADSLMDFLGTEIGIINSGVLNNGIKQGNVTKLILHELCPSPLNPTTFTLTGKQILISLEQSLLKEYQLMDGRGPGFRGKWLGNLQVSHNVEIQYESSRKSMEKIISVKINGTELDKEKEYFIGTSDYLQRGTGYSEMKQKNGVTLRPEYLRDILPIFLNKEEFIVQSFIKRFIEKK